MTQPRSADANPSKRGRACREHAYANSSDTFPITSTLHYNCVNPSKQVKGEIMRSNLDHTPTTAKPTVKKSNIPPVLPFPLKSAMKKFTLPPASVFAVESNPTRNESKPTDIIQENYLLSLLSITDERFATEEELYDIREDDDSTFVGPKEFIRTLNPHAFGHAAMEKGAKLFRLDARVLETLNNKEMAEEEGFEEDDLSSLPSEFCDFADIFSRKAGTSLPKHRPFDFEIELEEGKKPPFGPIYGLAPVEQEALKQYLAENIKSGMV